MACVCMALGLISAHAVGLRPALREGAKGFAVAVRSLEMARINSYETTSERRASRRESRRAHAGGLRSKPAVSAKKHEREERAGENLAAPTQAVCEVNLPL